MVFMGENMNKTTIFVMTHKKTAMPRESCYVPLHVGRNGGAGFGYQGDDTGDNISALNCHYGELTGLYWIWKNYSGQENIGICHYRRYFTDPSTRRLLTEEQYCRLLEEYDIVTSMVPEPDGMTNLEAYGQAHEREDMVRAGEIIGELYPQDRWAFDEVMGENGCSFGNLMVTSRKLFDEYCAWIFSIFNVMEQDMDFGKYPDDYHRRVFGFLAETLLNVWVRARRLNVCHHEVGVTGEKAETTELKLAVGQLVKLGRITEARQLFYDVIRVRPDVSLANADLKGEMFMIEQLLYIMELENEAGVNDGFAGYSNDLQALTDHFGMVSEGLEGLVLTMGDDGKGASADGWREGFARIFKDTTGISSIAVEVIARNNLKLQPYVEELVGASGAA
jgi:hypothetical protein